MGLSTIALLVSTANGAAAIVLSVLQIRDHWCGRRAKEASNSNSR